MRHPQPALEVPPVPTAARRLTGWIGIALLLGSLACAAAPGVGAGADGTRSPRIPTSSTSDGSLPTFENAPPALTAIAHESRSPGISRAPTQRDVLAERLANHRIVAIETPLRAPTLGIVVPSCHPLLRWCVAHATATSPA